MYIAVFSLVRQRELHKRSSLFSNADLRAEEAFKHKLILKVSYQLSGKRAAFLVGSKD
jgi:hypothetical protein